MNRRALQHMLDVVGVWSYGPPGDMNGDRDEMIAMQVADVKRTLTALGLDESPDALAGIIAGALMAHMDSLNHLAGDEQNGKASADSERGVLLPMLYQSMTATAAGQLLGMAPSAEFAARAMNAMAGCEGHGET